MSVIDEPELKSLREALAKFNIDSESDTETELSAGSIEDEE